MRGRCGAEARRLEALRTENGSACAAAETRGPRGVAVPPDAAEA